MPANTLVDSYMKRDAQIILTGEDVKMQFERIANTFARDMLITKFIQGTERRPGQGDHRHVQNRGEQGQPGQGNA